MSIPAWSFSALADFKNCPRAYYEKRVIKSVREEESPQMAEGNRVHKAFEDRQKDGLVLPPDLEVHEPYMRKLEDRPGETFTERRVALNTRLKPCTFFAKDVWERGIIDYTKVHEKRALIVDYKTGKPHTKPEQLALFALHVFYEHPEVQLADVRYYWTKTQSETRKVYGRSEIPEMWQMFTPDLKQYVEAFKTDTWQCRPSGLCYGWCPVTHCEHWKPKQRRR